MRNLHLGLYTPNQGVPKHSGSLFHSTRAVPEKKKILEEEFGVLLANQDARPEADAVVRGEALLLLRLLTVGVNSCAVGIGRNVQNGVEVKAAVQLFNLCLQRSSHGCVLRPAGCDNQAGHQAELGIDLADDFQASFLVGAAVYAADDVGLGNAAGLDALAGDLQRGCFLCGGGQQHDSRPATRAGAATPTA